MRDTIYTRVSLNLRVEPSVRWPTRAHKFISKHTNICKNTLRIYKRTQIYQLTQIYWCMNTNLSARVRLQSCLWKTTNCNETTHFHWKSNQGFNSKIKYTFVFKDGTKVKTIPGTSPPKPFTLWGDSISKPTPPPPFGTQPTVTWTQGRSDQKTKDDVVNMTQNLS